MRQIKGDGTLEDDWARWLDRRPWPVVDLDAVAFRRVVVLAPHPDDEVLGVGGLMMALAARGHEIVVVWATDGEASHPASQALTRGELAARRRQESDRALERLELGSVEKHRLGLPDGELARCGQKLYDAVAEIVSERDLVVDTWEYDGHPDHEAVGRAARLSGAQCWFYPIWMWHWGRPAHADIPWSQFLMVPVRDSEAKTEAIAEFVTQIQPLTPNDTDGVVLPPHVLARFMRPSEWLIA